MITIKKVVLNYPEFYTLGTNKDGTKRTKYSAKIILDPVEHKSAIRQLQAEIERIKTEVFKGTKVPTDKICLRNGDDLAGEEYEGKFRLSASSKRRPVTVDTQGRTLVEDDAKFYSGVIANVNVDLWSYNGVYKGISCELIAVQFVADGTPIGGGGISREAALQGFDVDAEADFG